jgi:glucose/arabinose dehydrogenase
MAWSSAWRWPVRSAVCLVVFAGLGLGWLASAQEETAAGAEEVASLTLPSGFTKQNVISGLSQPTSFTRLPDGRILIAQKGGVVRVFKNGALLPTPLIDISDQVNSYHDRGLLSIAVDPEFATTGHVYLLFTWDDDATDDSGPHTGRLARYTVVGDTASRASETVLLGTVVGKTCEDYPLGTDCIPSESLTHSVGDMAFAPDGTIILTTGEGAPFSSVDPLALRSQNLDSLGGKVLRITRDGQGLPDNPFWTGDSRANRSKVWARGLRNPFRFALHPGTNIAYVSDVGWNTWEEINVATKGANFGWPCYEGPNRQQGYAALSACQELYNQGPSAVKMPLTAWDHTVGRAAIAGTFYTGSTYPAVYQGAYFFGDFPSGWYRFLRVDSNHELVPGSEQTFSPDIGGLVDSDVGPDGNLYVLDLSSGQLHRFLYTGGGNRAPTAVASATPRDGAAPLTVRFSSAGSQDPDGDALQYSWDFGDGTAVSSEANPEHTYATEGRYTALLSVSDGRGGRGSATVQISVGNQAPVVTISSPVTSYRFRVGDVVTYAGSATDAEDGPLPATSLTWSVILRHCSQGACHDHPHFTTTGEGGQFTVPDHDDEFFFDMTLTATDSQGLTGSARMLLSPQMVRLTLQTSPPGLQVVYDGTAVTTPLTRDAIVGTQHILYAPSPQGSATFQSWSDGGEQRHSVLIGASDATYTATFHSSEPVLCPVGQYRAEYFNNRTLSGEPVLVRCVVAPVDHNWGNGSPAPGVATDNFSIRWRGRFNFAARGYTFFARADDGVRVFLDGVSIIDGWKIQAPTSYTASRTLTAGEHEVVLEYFDATGGAVIKLLW